jgi:hypothetical protein
MLLILLSLSYFFGQETEEPTIAATASGEVLDAWNETSLLDDTAEPECRWWKNEGKYVTKTCHLFSVSRLASQVEATAMDRALRCAAKFDTDCILGPEIGVGLPTVFIYDDAQGGLRMITAPRILGGNDLRDVRILSADGTNVDTQTFNHTLRVEFLEGSSRAPISEQFNGSMSYCVQFLRFAFHRDCWTNLD